MPKAKTLDISTLESWLWDAACQIRGPIDAPKFKDYILPLIFLKRISDVFDGEVERLGEVFGTWENAAELVERDHALVRFYVHHAAVITNDEARRNDYNLSPSRYVQVDGGAQVLPLEDAVVLLKEAEEERAAADAALAPVLQRLGLRV